jgi:hypothetical protein
MPHFFIIVVQATGNAALLAAFASDNDAGVQTS